MPSPGDDASLAEPFEGSTPVKPPSLPSATPTAADAALGSPGAGSRSAVLVVVGDLVEDVIVWASERVRHGTDTAAQVFRTRGGSGANVVLNCEL